MKRVLMIILAALCLGVPLAVQSQTNTSPGIASFWSKFQSAVANNDKQAVAGMTKFPLHMPYGVASIKTKAQLLTRYGKIFDAETKKCFAKAKPEVESAKAKKFSISCGEAMMYWFEVADGGYKFAAVDNVNE
jgi:hypothetical protein